MDWKAEFDKIFVKSGYLEEVCLYEGADDSLDDIKRFIETNFLPKSQVEEAIGEDEEELEVETRPCKCVFDKNYKRVGLCLRCSGMEISAGIRQVNRYKRQLRQQLELEEK